MNLAEDILVFLTAEGFGCKIESVCGCDVICVGLKDGRRRLVIPVRITARSQEDAEKQSSGLLELIKRLTEETGRQPLMITEDRWRSQGEMMKERLQAHLEAFFPVYARNCEIRKIDKAEAAAFLEANHSYGDAACRYRYGMFLRRHTGWRSQIQLSNPDQEKNTEQNCNIREALKPGTLIAVAEFSNARKWIKGDKTIRSYEWTRYASLPGVRINGGMGKMLKHFIKEVQPDDIMSYADLEWSEGTVYEQLGFTLEDQKEAVSFIIDCNTWERSAIKDSSPTHFTSILDSGCPQEEAEGTEKEDIRFFRNFGSNKYRLKLTDYQ